MNFIDIPSEDAAVKEEILKAFRKIVERGDFILGREVEEFELDVAAYLGVKNAVTVSSGTDALLLALRSLHLPKGTEVITTSFTFFATTEAILNEGLVPVYVDIDPCTYNIDPSKVEEAITAKTGAILPVHLFGRPARMDNILAVAGKYGLSVVEDCAQAFGAELGGKKVGTFGDIGCFSFYPTKNLGAYGDAGLIVTDNDGIAGEVRILRNQGSKVPYRHELVGVNSRCDTLQAAVLKAKLPYVDVHNERRRCNAALYRALLSDIGIVLPGEAVDEKSVYHQYTVAVNERGAMREFLSERGIPTAVYYDMPLHLQRAVIDLGCKSGDLSCAEAASRRVLSLPVSSSLTFDNVTFVAENIKKFILKNGEDV